LHENAGMENLCFPGNPQRFLTDNTQFIFKKEYCEGKMAYHASFHPDPLYKEGSETVMRYKVVLEHYTGTHIFYMIKQNTRWVISCENISYLIAKVGMTRIDWIAECINEHFI
jgi:hypothetical protein